MRNLNRNFWRRWAMHCLWAVPIGLACFWLLKMLYCWFAEAGGFTLIWDLSFRLRDL